jgi:hypothetical protein
LLRGTTARPPFGQKIVPIFWPGLRLFNFPEKNYRTLCQRASESFSGPLGLVTSAQRVPAQTKKKEKIGTIFWPKGGLAVVNLNYLRQKKIPEKTTALCAKGQGKVFPAGQKLGQFSAQREALR